jgi:hypothetical protein
MKFTILLTALAAPSMVFGNLDQMMKSNGRKYIGAATDPDTFNDSNVESILQSEFGSLTAENSMKVISSSTPCLVICADLGCMKWESIERRYSSSAQHWQ